MPDGPMEEEQRLRDVLQRLAEPAAPVTERGQLIAETGGQTALTALLREIAETVLPRRLRFDGGMGGVLTCDVAERRIQSFGTGAAEALAEIAIEDAPDVAAALQCFSKAAVALHVQRDIVPHDSAAGALGVSIPDLLHHLAGKDTNTVPKVSAATARAESESHALAILDGATGSDHCVKGQEGIAVHLRALEENWTAGASPDAPTAPMCQIWTGGVSDTFAILLVTLETGRIWVAFEPEHLDTCVACWSRVG